MSDFRGMGLLGLEDLLFFAEEYNGAARHVLSHSLHPRHGYTFAIVGINLTSMAYTLLKTGVVKTHIYNLNTTTPNLDHFHKLYCYLFFEFDKYWMECKPTSLMDFSNIHDKFQTNILAKLNDNRTAFKLNFSVDYVWKCGMIYMISLSKVLTIHMLVNVVLNKMQDVCVAGELQTLHNLYTNDILSLKININLN